MSRPYSTEILTRWMDADAYGHVNNAQYYSYFDTAVTSWLIGEAGVDPGTDPSIGICVESKCHFKAPLSFPETITAAVSIAKVTRSTARFQITLFDAKGAEAAEGYFVHVQVDRQTRRPTPIPPQVRERMQEL
jgi:acyl-CoA thioester hydrolase